MNKPKRCLVTGGAGFIGSHLVELLLNKGYKVTVVDDLSEGKWDNLPQHRNLIKHHASILGNISEFAKNKDVVFHLAAIPSPQRSVSEPWRTHRTNVDGTLNVLLAAKENKVKKFIFSSTYMVYPKPLVPYTLQKLTGEKYCRLFYELWGIETICLRYFNVYGSRMKSEGHKASLLPKFIKLISQDKAPEINGDGEQTRDFVHVSDVAEANLAAALSPYKGKVFNVGSGKPITINEVVSILNLSLGKNIKPLHNPALIEPRITKSESGIKRLPSWKPKIKFKEGIKSMLNVSQ